MRSINKYLFTIRFWLINLNFWLVRNHLLVLHAHNYFINCFDLFEQCKPFLLHFVISFNHPGRIHGEGLITDIGTATARVARLAKMFFSCFFLNRLNQYFGFKYTPDWTVWSSKFKKFSGEGLTEPPPHWQSPDPSPRSFSGFALDSGFALKSRALRALDSGFTDSDPQLLKRGCAPVLVNKCITIDTDTSIPIPIPRYRYF